MKIDYYCIAFIKAEMLTMTLDSKCWIVLCLVLLHIILLSIPMMLGVYTMATYFEMSQGSALTISCVVICSVIQLSFINIKSSVMLYNNITHQINTIE
jgi:hypothetical protein